MADKPSRALILYGDGLAPFVDPSHTHLHSLASIASCGFLSLPNAPPSESEDERIVREFAVLMDACETCLSMGGHSTDAESQWNSTLSERFMGMKAAMLTNNSSLKSFGGKLGFSIFHLNELIKHHHAIANPQANVVASELLQLLGFQEQKVLEANYFDLVFLHLGAGENINSKEDQNIAAEVEYINALVGAITCLAQPGSDIGSRLHLSVVMSYGNVSGDNNTDLSVLKAVDERNSYLSKLFPQQSYTMKGEIPRKDIRHYCPMLIAQWQYAVTRKDMAEGFSFKDFKELGGNLTIPADRFLHEVAFKLWKAPKYGA
ncbi:hypothetical protein O6P43_019089 [Quillaja saponaria]|uniref:Uncharacterized protein n=1 Tax=Quillaja saponaria TaxID=32244 RepID=A0AAD7PKD4_QUISA|nr:hypothetical protein O6P43_019089 [Quillaja saponaria]